MRKLARRVDVLERERAPETRLFVCWCAKNAGRHNVDEHEPDCPAHDVRPDDTLLVVTYPESDEAASI